MGYDRISPKFIRVLYHKLIFAGHSKDEASQIIIKFIDLVNSEKDLTIKQILANLDSK